MTITHLALLAYPIVFIVCQSIVALRVRARRLSGKPALPARTALTMCAATFLATSLIVSKDSAQPGLIRFIIGMIAVIAGLALSMWAMSHLGRNWVNGVGVHRNHRLVDSGPYRRVRHPLYSGVCMSMLGICIAAPDVFLVLAALTFAAAISCQAIPEESMLKKHRKLGPAYERYVAHTGMFVPRIRKGK